MIGVTESEVILDLKYYTEGIIRLADYTEDPDFSIKQDVAIGDTVSAEVISLDDGNGNILLSRKQANDVLAWDKLKEYMENGTDLTVQIKGVVNKGVIAYVEGIPRLHSGIQAFPFLCGKSGGLAVKRDSGAGHHR